MIQIHPAISPLRIGVDSFFFPDCPKTKVIFHIISCKVRFVFPDQCPFKEESCHTSSQSCRKTGARCCSVSVLLSCFRYFQINPWCCKIRFHNIFCVVSSSCFYVEAVVPVIAGSDCHGILCISGRRHCIVGAWFQKIGLL